jgi:hypothetical protein
MFNIRDNVFVTAAERPSNQSVAKLQQVLTHLAACSGEIIKRVEVDE